MKILIVDDEFEICKVLKDMLDDMGYETFICSSGKDVLPIIENIYFDLLLLDINMPDLSGIDVIRELRKRNNRIKIIAVTAIDNELAKKYIEELGIDGYIIKPVKYDYLKKVLLDHIEKLTKS